MNGHKWVALGIKIVVFLAIVVAGFGQAVLQLWNWLVPGIFGLRPITFWQALGLMGLSWILFGGLRGLGFHAPSQRRHAIEGLTPGEREIFRKGIESRG